MGTGAYTQQHEIERMRAGSIQNQCDLFRSQGAGGTAPRRARRSKDITQIGREGLDAVIKVNPRAKLVREGVNDVVQQNSDVDTGRSGGWNGGAGGGSFEPGGG